MATVNCQTPQSSEKAFTQLLVKVGLKKSLPIEERKNFFLKGVQQIYLNNSSAEVQNSLIDIYNRYKQTKAGQELGAILPDIQAAFVSDIALAAQIDGKVAAEGFDEQDLNARKSVVTEDFLEDRYGISLARHYFLHQAREELVDTLLVNRSNPERRLAEDTKSLNMNVKAYQNILADRLASYLNVVPTHPFDENTGRYHSIADLMDRASIEFAIWENETNPNDAESMKREFHDQLTIKYNDYLSGDENAKKYLDAYNAYVLLTNFDTCIQQIIGNVVTIDPRYINKFHNSNQKYRYITTATNMWSNKFGDDVEDVADLVSSVTMHLIESSHLYRWRSNIPLTNQNLSFAQFNSAISSIKDLAYNPTAWTEFGSLGNLTFNVGEKEAISQSTRNFINRNPNMTLGELAAKISQDPFRNFQYIVEILAHSEISSQASLNISPFTKNIIWTIDKEIFGQGDRSILRICEDVKSYGPYSTIVQLANSLFGVDYSQIYEDDNGIKRVRSLIDYAKYREEEAVINRINEQSNAFDSNHFDDIIRNSGVQVTPKLKAVTLEGGNQSIEVLQNLLINIPISENLDGQSITIEVTPEGAQVPIIPQGISWFRNDSLHKTANDKLNNFVMQVLGIDLNADPEFKSILLEVHKNQSSEAVRTLTKVAGRALFNLYYNNKILPQALKTLNTSRTYDSCRRIMLTQFRQSDVRFNQNYGTISILGTKDRAYVDKLAEVNMILKGTAASARVRTGEGTDVSNYMLSTLKSNALAQITDQCNKETSATKSLNIINDRSLFLKPVVAKEFKSTDTAKKSISFTGGEGFQYAFLNDFVAGYARTAAVDDRYQYDTIRNGIVGFIPTVNSDKPQIDKLLINLNTIEQTTGKAYKDLTDDELNEVIIRTFGPVYENIWNNLATDLQTAVRYLRDNGERLFGQGIEELRQMIPSNYNTLNPVIKNRILLNFLSDYFVQCSQNPNSSLAAYSKKSKNAIQTGLWMLTRDYNQSHLNNPLQLGEELHYKFNDNGLLIPNITLTSLYGRFNPATINILKSDSNNRDPRVIFVDHQSTTSEFFRMKDILTARDLLNSNFKVNLANSATNTDSPEAIFLRTQFPNWVNEEGEMIIAKAIAMDGEEYEITTAYDLEQYQGFPDVAIEIHPMLSKMNRLHYLFTQQWDLTTVGSHVYHKSKKGKNAIELEGSGWNAYNKRNNALTATIHTYLPNVLNGCARTCRIAIMDDIESSVYNPMGFVGTHTPLDGSMIGNGWDAYLNNNSLEGEAVGLDTKPFGTFYFENLAAAGTVKTASFACTNDRMRKYGVYRQAQKNMTNIPWIDQNGNRIIVDFTRNGITGNKINHGDVYYSREQNGKVHYYKLENVMPITNENGQLTGEFEIQEVLVNSTGIATTGVVETRRVNINTNWGIFTEVFGGYNSLEIGSNGRLIPSENSIHRMVETINQVGRKIGDSPEIKTQDDFYQPLKYSEIQYLANKGAIKSSYTNINPSDCLYTDMPLNFFSFDVRQLGVQLDKEHEADDEDVSMPTQIIQACINRGFTQNDAIDIYYALSTLTDLAINPYIDGVKELLDNVPGYKGKLQTTIALQILKDITETKGNNEALKKVLGDLVNKYKSGEVITPADVIGKVAWSSNSIYNQVFSKVASHLTKNAIRMKFAGILAVITPGHIAPLYGDKTLDYYEQVEDFDPIEGFDSPEVQLRKEQEAIRNGDLENNGSRLIFDITRDGNNQQAIKNQISHIETQHNYIIEYDEVDEKGNIVSEEKTINTPQDYYNLRRLILNPEGTRVVTKVYENITKPRELAAYNVRFKSSDGLREFCIFDLDSTAKIFQLASIKGIAATNSTILYNILTSGILGAQTHNFLNRVRQTIGQDYYTTLVNMASNLPNPNNETTEQLLVRLLCEPDFAEMTLEIANSYLRVIQQDDLLKLSKSYTGPNRTVYTSDGPINVDVKSIDIIPYELIVPKLYRKEFGLDYHTNLQRILEDPDYFTKRAINRLRQTGYTSILGKDGVKGLCTYILKTANGQHYYILDEEQLKTASPELQKLVKQTTNVRKVKRDDGTYEAVDFNNEHLFDISSNRDKIFEYEGQNIICTKNVGFYLDNLTYTAAIINTGVDLTTKEELQASIERIKESSPNSQLGRVDLSSSTWYEDLNNQANAFNSITLETVKNHSKDHPFSRLLNKIASDGRSMYISFEESLNMVAGRIPGQSQQSFMTQKVAGFDSRDANTAMVSTFQLFLEGSDLDIDTVTLLGSAFKNGKYIAWSPYANLQSKSTLEASKLLPAPTSKASEMIQNNNKDSFFIQYRNLFDPNTGIFDVSINSKGELVVKLKRNTPEQIKALANLIKDVNENGLNLRTGQNTDYTETNSLIVVREGINSEVMNLGQLEELGYKILDIINTHNNYINRVSNDIKQDMIKNFILTRIQNVIKSPSNITEAMVSIDVPTKVIQKLAGQSISASQDLESAPGSAFSVQKGIREGQVGKNCVGIGAVAIKVNAFTQCYYDLILNSGKLQAIPIATPTQFDALKGRTNGRVLIVNNIYDKTTEQSINLSGDPKISSQNNTAYRNIINSILSSGLLETNSNETAAAMLSEAVDNAKSLTLAKINAGQAMIGMYDYGISCGFDSESLVNVINSEQGQLISKYTEENTYDGMPSERNAIGAISVLEGNISKYLSHYNSYTKGMRIGGNRKQQVVDNAITDLLNELGLSAVVADVINNQGFSGRNLGEALQLITNNGKLFLIKDRVQNNQQALAFFNWYEDNSKAIFSNGDTASRQDKILTAMLKGEYIKQCWRNQSKVYTNPEAIVYTLAIQPNFNDILESIKSNDIYNDLYLATQNSDEELSEQQKFFNGLRALMKWTSLYSRDLQIWNSSAAVKGDLKKLAIGAEEMRVIGVVCSSNREVKNKPQDAATFIKTISEMTVNMANNRNKLNYVPGEYQENTAEPIDFIRFMEDPIYAQQACADYDKVMERTNPLRMILTVPHLNGYVRTNIIPQAFTISASSRARAIERYNTQEWSRKLGLQNNTDRENYIRNLNRAINMKYLLEWLSTDNITFGIPAQFEYFTYNGTPGFRQNIKVVSSNENMVLPLGTEAGLASFKRYMEVVAIPFLKKFYSDNEFVKHLRMVDMNNLPSKAASSVFSLDVDLMPKHGSLEESRLLEIAAAFNLLRGIKLPNTSNSLANFADAFYLYSMYVYGGAKGHQSLMAMFDYVDSNLQNKYNTFIAQKDATGDVYLSDSEIISWCAMKRSRYSTLGEYAWIQDRNRLGPTLKRSEESIAKEQEARRKQASSDMDIGEESYEDIADIIGEEDEAITPYDEYWREFSPVTMSLDREHQTWNYQYLIYPGYRGENVTTQVTGEGDERWNATVDLSTGKIVSINGESLGATEEIRQKVINKLINDSPSYLRPAFDYSNPTKRASLVLDVRVLRDVVRSTVENESKGC